MRGGLSCCPSLLCSAHSEFMRLLRAFEGTYYEWGPYLSPFYSPLIDPHHRWWPFSPALLILVWPLGFRVTCYYYRKAYYRAFFLDPPACAVSERGSTAIGVRLRFRLFCKISIAIFCMWASSSSFFLWRDAFRAFFFDGRFGVGVGTLVLLFNVILLTLCPVLPLAPPPRRRKARLLFLRGLRAPAPYGLALAGRFE